MAGRKHLVAFLVVCALTVGTVSLANLNLVIVAMVKVDDLRIAPSPGPKYDWSPSTQGLILGASNVGLVLTQIPAGRLAERYGGKWICFVGIFLSGLINILTPIVAQFLGLMIFSRVVLGMAQGLVFPACVDIIFSWMGRSNPALMFGLMSLGLYAGSILTTLTTGYLCDQTAVGGGWPSAFLLPGILTVLWTFLWIPIVGNHPKDLSGPPTETSSLLHNEGNSSKKEEDDRKSRYRSFPLRAMARSGPVWAVITMKLSHSWASASVVAKLPAYLQEEIGMTTSVVGLITGLIYIPLCLSVTLSSLFSDIIIQKNLMTRTRTRKVFQGIAVGGASLCIILIPWIGHNIYLLVTSLVFSKIFFGIQSGGESPLVAEMTTRFSSTLYAITNVASFLTGLLTPWFCGLILESTSIGDSSDQWSLIFYIAASLNLFGGVIFCIFADANIQPWDGDDHRSEVLIPDNADPVDENHNPVSQYMIHKTPMSDRAYLVDSLSFSK